MRVAERSLTKTRRCVRRIAAIVTMIAASAAAAPPPFTSVVKLGATPGEGSREPSYIHAISATGGVAGTGSPPNLAQRFAVRWTLDGTAHALASPPGIPDTSAVNDVNDAGVSVGVAHMSGVGDLPVRWAADGTPSVLGNVAGQVQGWSGATALNNAGQAVGNAAFNATTGSFSGVRWAADGTGTRLGTFANQTESNANSINASGAVVGFVALAGENGNRRAVRWSAQGTGTLLGTVRGAVTIDANAMDINDSGQVAGTVNLQGAAGGLRAVRWSASDVAVPLGQAPGQNGLSVAYAIDRLGQVVGHAAIAPTGIDRAVLWDSAGTGYLLQDLIAGGGWTLTDASGIDTNDTVTRVVAFGSNPAFNNGNPDYFIFSVAVPEPASAIGFAASLAMLSSRRRQAARDSVGAGR